MADPCLTSFNLVRVLGPLRRLLQLLKHNERRPETRLEKTRNEARKGASVTIALASSRIESPVSPENRRTVFSNFSVSAFSSPVFWISAHVGGQSQDDSAVSRLP